MSHVQSPQLAWGSLAHLRQSACGSSDCSLDVLHVASVSLHPWVHHGLHRLYGAGCLNMIHNILAPLGFMGRMLKSKSRISSVVVGRVGLDASCGFMRNVVVCVGCLEFGLCSREAIRYDIDWYGDYIQSSGCGSPCIGFDPMEEANLLTASLHLQYK